MREIRSQSSTGGGSPWTRPNPIPLVTSSDLVNPMEKVGDVMTASPRTCHPASTVIEAVMIFRDADCGVIPITDAGKVLGVLTDRDVALALAGRETTLAETPVEDLMSKDLVTIGFDDTLEVAVERLGEQGVRRLMVVDNEGLLVGILSWVDLIPHLSERGLGRVVAQIVEHQR